MTDVTEAEVEALSNLARQVEQATYIGFHKGNYGLKHYASNEQKRMLHSALLAAARIRAPQAAAEGEVGDIFVRLNGVKIAIEDNALCKGDTDTINDAAALIRRLVAKRDEAKATDEELRNECGRLNMALDEAEKISEQLRAQLASQPKQAGAVDFSSLSGTRALIAIKELADRLIREEQEETALPAAPAGEMERLRALVAVIEEDEARNGLKPEQRTYCSGECIMPKLRAALGKHGELLREGERS